MRPGYDSGACGKTATRMEEMKESDIISFTGVGTLAMDSKDPIYFTV